MTIERVTGLTEDDFGFDELVADDASVHIERMDRDHIWMSVRSGGREVVLNFHLRKRTLWVNVEMEP